MSGLLGRLGITVNLGRCMFCMRAAFFSAVSLWLFVLAAFVITSRVEILVPLIAAATAFSLLWLVHLATYAGLVARHRTAAAAAGLRGLTIKPSRRELFGTFAKAFAAMAVATMLPAMWGSARAQGTCPDDTPVPCGTQYCCAGTALYFCSGYTGNVPNWRQMGEFCTNANTNEDVADLRSNCAVFVQC